MEEMTSLTKGESYKIREAVRKFDDTGRLREIRKAIRDAFHYKHNFLNPPTEEVFEITKEEFSV